MRVHWFASISGLGWLLDAITLLFLVAIGVQPFAANLCSAGLAVTLVFFLSQRTIFFANSRFLAGKFCAYVVWNAFGVLVASALVAMLGEVFGDWIIDLRQWGVVPGWLPGGLDKPVAVAAAKVSVTPLTMYANYVILSLIMEGRASWR
jgi:putative flippase GtrA